ncbi:alpha-amylase 1-like [Branchiostoma lanceolatum]|uniref:alpha-amylase 1-like n=1 Tax=Branchiostoma lanceolatum TaxID=7740 RepID=UPI00345552EF
MSILILLLVGLSGTAAQHAPNTIYNKEAIVQLFEWRWADIAEECERFLGPYGFGGVQVSPPSENVPIEGRPWYERYQPVSYLLNTRSGNDGEFRDMVHRCNQQGVRIYADLVINHMSESARGCGFGTGGSYFNTNTKEFEGVPYGSSDFNCNDDATQSRCPTSDCKIYNYDDPSEVRNCQVNGMVDLKLGNEYVRGKIVDYINYLISIGVAGIRIDAAKHMWPGDLEAIFGRLNDLNTAYFWPGSRPFIFMEVVSGGTISPPEYIHLGRVEEFGYGMNLGLTFRKVDDRKLKSLRNFGKDWGMTWDSTALVFVDNHNSQRGHGGGGPSVLTFRDSRLYKMASAFMLAFPYGFARVMSSFYWEQYWEDGKDVNNWVGPPADNEGNILPVQINGMGTCDNGWVCEHRWRQIRNMVLFRNLAAGHGMYNWWDNNFNQIAFSRGDRAFIVINNDDGWALDETLQTGLPQGDYCDVISGDVSEGGCTGKTITVGWDRTAHIHIAPDEEDPMVAIHVASKVGSNRMAYPVYRASKPRSTAPVHADLASDQRDMGDGAHGSALVWTTNDANYNATVSTDGYGYTPLNQWGPDYWMLDVDMDCSRTENGWFEVKALLGYGCDRRWEGVLEEQGTCSGTAVGTKPYSSDNHFAQCGKVNVFEFDDSTCTINNFEYNNTTGQEEVTTSHSSTSALKESTTSPTSAFEESTPSTTSAWKESSPSPTSASTESIPSSTSAWEPLSNFCFDRIYPLYNFCFDRIYPLYNFCFDRSHPFSNFCLDGIYPLTNFEFCFDRIYPLYNFWFDRIYPLYNFCFDRIYPKSNFCFDRI